MYHQQYANRKPNQRFPQQNEGYPNLKNTWRKILKLSTQNYHLRFLEIPHTWYKP